MPRANSKYPSGIRLKANARYEYRRNVSQAEINDLFATYGERLDGEVPENFWKPGQWIEASSTRLADVKAARENILAACTLRQWVPQKVQKALARVEGAEQAAEAARSSVTLKDVFEAYMAFVEQNGTRRTYRSQFNTTIAETLGPRPVIAITGPEVEEWYQATLKAHGANLARNAYATLNRVYKYATGKDRRLSRHFVPFVDDNPCDFEPRPQSKKKAGGVILETEHVHFLAEHMPAHLAIAVYISRVAGLRIGEVQGLTREHVAFADGGVWLTVSQQLVRAAGGAELGPPKSNAGEREVPALVVDGIDFPALLRAHLEEHVHEADEAHIIPARSGAQGWASPTQMGRAAREAFRALEAKYGKPVRGATFHDLRHTALTDLGKRGAGQGDLKAFGGHTDAAAVAIYQGSSRSSLRRLSGLADAGS